MTRVCHEVVARSSKKILEAKEAEALAFVLPKRDRVYVTVNCSGPRFPGLPVESTESLRAAVAQTMWLVVWAMVGDMGRVLNHVHQVTEHIALFLKNVF